MQNRPQKLLREVRVPHNSSRTVRMTVSGDSRNRPEAAVARTSCTIRLRIARRVLLRRKAPRRPMRKYGRRAKFAVSTQQGCAWACVRTRLTMCRDRCWQSDGSVRPARPDYRPYSKKKARTLSEPSTFYFRPRFAVVGRMRARDVNPHQADALHSTGATR
jgi:hypothetical protein